MRCSCILMYPQPALTEDEDDRRIYACYLSGLVSRRPCGLLTCSSCVSQDPHIQSAATHVMTAWENLQDAAEQHVQTPATFTSHHHQGDCRSGARSKTPHICMHTRVFPPHRPRGNKHARRRSAERPRPASAPSKQQSGASRPPRGCAAPPWN